jgi:hypothetical protein
MSTNNQQTSDTGQTAILIAIAIVTIAGVLGAVFSDREAAQIIGFCTLINIALLGRLQHANTVAKLEETKAKVDQVQATVTTNGNGNGANK